MAALQTAQIIPFPRRAPPPEAASPQQAPLEDGAIRLRRALAALDDALARQRGAMADWRSGLAALQRDMGGLGASLGGYGDRLSALDRSLGRLRTATRRRME